MSAPIRLAIVCVGACGLVSVPGTGAAQDENHDAPQPASASPPAPLTLAPRTLRAPRAPAKGWGLASLSLAPQQLSQTLLPQKEELATAQALPQGFLSLNVPKEITVESVATQAGLFAGKMWLMKELCGLGRCRVDTGPETCRWGGSSKSRTTESRRRRSPRARPATCAALARRLSARRRRRRCRRPRRRCQ